MEQRKRQLSCPVPLHLPSDVKRHTGSYKDDFREINELLG